MIAPWCSSPLKTLALPLESRRYLNYWQSYKNFQFIPFVIAAILNFLLILISHISADCSIVFPTSKNIGVAVGIALISQFFGKVKSTSGLWQFLDAILNFLLMSMSGISGDCTIAFPIFETINLAVRIVSISHFLAKL